MKVTSEERTIELAIDTLRVLSVDAIQKANSGHPGIALGAAPMAYACWSCMRHNPSNPNWQNRDRFVLSAGHGSALLYSLLVLFGYDLALEDLKQFRQLGSRTPGHPEYGKTIGVETSTGPLGQGFANAVGFAQAESILASKFNRDGYNIVDHYTFCLASDGDMMEGITQEAASLAGVWQLSKLIVLYDSNDISIEGDTNRVFLDDTQAKYVAMGWNVLTVTDGMNYKAVIAAINQAKSQTQKPTLIILKTVIGHGSDKSGHQDSHGAALGASSVTKLKQSIGWTYGDFAIPPTVSQYMCSVKTGLALCEQAWNKTVDEYKSKYNQDYVEYCKWLGGKDIIKQDDLQSLYQFVDKAEATRTASGIVLNKLAALMPNLVGGSGDLAPSNKTVIDNGGQYSATNRTGRNIGYGVREHAMAGIANGMCLHGGLVNFVSTFFVFSDYCKHSIRMSAIMNLPMLYIFTHDSIGVGEDGCTHQPIEQLTGLRSMPNLTVFRPADSRETAAGYNVWLNGNSPVALILSRQNLPVLPNSGIDAMRGGYIVSNSKIVVPQVIIIATGSEVGYALEAQKLLSKQGIDARVVSMPSCELFDSQDSTYKQSVLPDSVRARVAVEAGASMGWYKFVGLDGEVVGIDSFGLSGKAEAVFEHFGFDAQSVVNAAVRVVSKYANDK